MYPFFSFAFCHVYLRSAFLTLNFKRSSSFPASFYIHLRHYSHCFYFIFLRNTSKSLQSIFSLCCLLLKPRQRNPIHFYFLLFFNSSAHSREYSQFLLRSLTVQFSQNLYRYNLKIIKYRKIF